MSARWRPCVHLRALSGSAELLVRTRSPARKTPTHYVRIVEVAGSSPVTSTAVAITTTFSLFRVQVACPLARPLGKHRARLWIVESAWLERTSIRTPQQVVPAPKCCRSALFSTASEDDYRARVMYSTERSMLIPPSWGVCHAAQPADPGPAREQPTRRTLVGLAHRSATRAEL
jgi:hypothetical protein